MTLPKDFKPMLAVNTDKVKTQPLVRYTSEKLDGIRMVVFDGVGYSRSLKPLPNKQLQAYCKYYADLLEGFDGEIIAGDLYAVDVLQQSNSFCMSEDKVINDWKFYVFDRYDSNLPWVVRYLSIVTDELDEHTVKHQHYYLRDFNQVIPRPYQEYQALLPWVDLDWFEQQVLTKGGEGVMIRDALAQYKCGRSGTKTPELQKVKRFQDAEFRVIGYNQFETNQNEAQTNELGRTFRSTSKAGKQLVDQLGSLVCVTAEGVDFNVGSGFTEQQRKDLWKENQEDTLIGRLAVVQYFGLSKDGVPLLPVFKAFRDCRDLS
jgi:DNA ligase-1